MHRLTGSRCGARPASLPSRPELTRETSRDHFARRVSAKRMRWRPTVPRGRGLHDALFRSIERLSQTHRTVGIGVRVAFDHTAVRHRVGDDRFFAGRNKCVTDTLGNFCRQLTLRHQFPAVGNVGRFKGAVTQHDAVFGADELQSSNQY